MKRKIVARFARESKTGVDVPASGFLEAAPSARRTLDGRVIMPGPFSVQLVDGAADFVLASTDGLWHWIIRERVFDGTVRHVNVPEGDPDVILDYKDLPDLEAP